MELILYPQQDDRWPVGMTHPVGDACPFDGLEHPRGETCCSFDATDARVTCREAGGDPFAELAAAGFIDAESAHALAFTLRDAFTNSVVFHVWNAPRGRFVKAYDEARDAGDDNAEWLLETIPEALGPMLRAADWFACLGESAHGARVVTQER